MRMSRQIRRCLILMCLGLMITSAILMFAILPLLCTPAGNTPGLLPRIVLPLADRFLAIGDILLMVGLVIGVTATIEE